MILYWLFYSPANLKFEFISNISEIFPNLNWNVRDGGKSISSVISNNSVSKSHKNVRISQRKF